MPVARYAKTPPQKDNPKSVTPRLTVTKAAELLGVHRVHLSRVLHHHRQSRSLTRRYQQLLAQHQATAS